MTTLEAALRQFDATEANLGKLEKLWEQIYSLIPEGPAFGSPPEYGELCLAVRQILPALPAIDGFRVTDQLHEYDAIGQMRLDALEVGEIESKVAVENAIEEQGRQLREYRFKFQTKRRHLVRDRLLALIDHADDLLRRLGQRDQERPANSTVGESAWDELKEAVAEIDTLIGSSSRPSRWSDLQRHLHFGMEQDLLDIQRLDWPSVKAGLREDLYGQHDPVPVDVADLGDMVASKPIGAVTTSLNWSVLSDEDFERLVFLLLPTLRAMRILNGFSKRTRLIEAVICRWCEWKRIGFWESSAIEQLSSANIGSRRVSVQQTSEVFALRWSCGSRLAWITS